MPVFGIITEYITGDGLRIMPGLHPAGDKQVQVAVMVKIRRPDTKFTAVIEGQRSGIQCKIPFPIIDV